MTEVGLVADFPELTTTHQSVRKWSGWERFELSTPCSQSGVFVYFQSQLVRRQRSDQGISDSPSVNGLDGADRADAYLIPIGAEGATSSSTFGAWRTCSKATNHA